jgi:hypothetical protein
MPIAILTVAFVLVATLPQSSGGASIRGRVTDDVSGAAIARAVVTLGFLGPGSQKWETSTSDDGSFEFRQLPAGGFKLVAEPPPGATTHVSRRYGQSARFDPARHEAMISPVQLSAGGELVADIELPRALSVSGRVLDASGLPVRNVLVLVRSLNGGYAARPGRPPDANGRFTVHGLRPNEYDVCAVPSVSAALLRSRGRIEGEQPLETCHPVDAASSGSSRHEDLDITLRYGAVFSIAGEVVDSTGTPIEANALQLTTSDGRNVDTADVRHEGSGFTIRGVPPGEYRLTARRATGTGQMIESGRAVVRVAADVEGIVVRTLAAVSIAGRVEYAEGAPSPRPMVNVNTVGHRIRPVGRFENVAHVGADSTFRLDALVGPQMFQVFGAMRPWAVQAIRYRGKDIYGRSVELRSSDNPDDLVVVLTNRSASVTAKLRGPDGPPGTDAAVVLIPLDPATGAALENAAVRPILAEGSLGLPLVRPGDYLIAAVAPEDVSGTLTSVVPHVARVARRITLAPREHRAIDLDLVRLSRAR